jgi:hypothetical protein
MKTGVCKHWLVFLASLILALSLVLGPAAAAGPEGGSPGAGGQVEKPEGEKAKPKGVAKPKMMEPEKPEGQDTESKFKTRGMQPPPAARQVGKGIHMPGGGQPIRSKESPE